MRPVLLYDADCGFCTLAAGWMLRIGCAIETVPWQSWQPLASHGITTEAAAAAIHLVDGDEVLIGHEAIARALESSRYALVRLAGSAVGSALLRPVASRVYTLVASHRHRLPGGTAACALEPPPDGRQPT